LHPARPRRLADREAAPGVGAGNPRRGRRAGRSYGCRDRWTRPHRPGRLRRGVRHAVRPDTRRGRTPPGWREHLMTINESLAQNSNWAYTSAVAIYVLSMFFYLAEQAFGRSRQRAGQRGASRALVTAGGGAD